jgi:hypothetical protein
LVRILFALLGDRHEGDAAAVEDVNVNEDEAKIVVDIHRFCRGSLAKYNPRAHSRHFGKNRLQPPSRHRRASHCDFRDAADEPGLTRRHFRKSQKSRAPYQS